MKNKKLLSLLMVFVMLLSFVNPVFAIEDSKVKEIVAQTQEFMGKKVPAPTMGTLGGEWTVFGLARSGAKVPENYYEDYYKRVSQKVDEKNGDLHHSKFTEYSRIIVAFTAIGKDVENVAGHNLIKPLANFKNIIRQGINGPIWALIAYDSKNFEIPKIEDEKSQNSRERMIEYILDLEITDGNGVKGGWAMSGDKADPDITAMAMYAFRPYYKSNEKVKAAVDRALTVLSNLQLQSGGYNSWGSENSESTAQVIIALTALGIDPATDKRFIKNDKDGNASNPIDALARYYVEGGGFRHVMDADVDAMGTDQGLEGMVAYLRFKEGKTALFDMTDVKSKTDTSTEVNLVFKDIANSWAKESINKSKGYGIANNSENFMPNKEITRAEFAVAINSGFKLSTGEKTSNFADVKDSDWFVTAVKNAASNGIILGKGQDKFDPNAKITREEAMTMLQRVLKLKGFAPALKADAKEYLKKYPDGTSVSDWAVDSAAFNIENKIIQGRPSGIAPKGDITRAEAVTVVERSIGLVK